MAGRTTSETKETIIEKEKKVTINLPRIKDRPSEFVSINEKTYLVKRGEPVEVPESVAAAFLQQDRMLAEIEAFEEANARN